MRTFILRILDLFFKNVICVPHTGLNFTLISGSSFLMSDGEFPGQNIQHNGKDTGYHWYTQHNSIRA